MHQTTRMRRPLSFALSFALFFALSISPVMSHAQYTTLKLHDDFNHQGALPSAWQVATWRNGPPFGCSFAAQQVSLGEGLLSLGFKGQDGSCSEVRTLQRWKYGSFVVDMKPSEVPGVVSSFFLYTGTAGTSSHYEIDIEFLGSTGILHTNAWVAGQPSPQDIDLRALGIDPHASSRHYRFNWQPDSIAWYLMDDAGHWVELRRIPVSVAVPMQLMMNSWYGTNTGNALIFPGPYDGTPGKATYNSVSVFQ